MYKRLYDALPASSEFIGHNYNQARAEIYEQLREMHHASASI